MAGQPKTPFYVVLALVVAGLVAFAVYRSDDPGARKATPATTGKIDPRPTAARTAGIGRTAAARPIAAARHHGQGIHLQAGRAAAGDQGHVGLQADGRQHRAVRLERLGRLGTDHPGQQRLQAGQGLEDARRRGVPASSWC